MREASVHGTSARCYCGVVTLRAQAPATSVIHCHCGQCRRLSGAAFTTWVSFPGHAVSIAGAEHLVAFNATSNVTRHFCKACGSHLWTMDSRYPDLVGIAAGCIDGALSPAPSAHYFVSHKAVWHTIGDALPQFGGESGFAPCAWNALPR